MQVTKLFSTGRSPSRGSSVRQWWPFTACPSPAPHGRATGGPHPALCSFPTPRTHTRQRGVLGPPYGIHLDTCHLAPVERNYDCVDSDNVEGLGGSWLQSLGPACNWTPGWEAPSSLRHSLQGGVCGPSLSPLVTSSTEFLHLWSGGEVASLLQFGCWAAAY